MDIRLMLLVLVAMAFILLGVVAWLAMRAKPAELRLRQIELMQKALAHPQLDLATREELLRVLARDHAGLLGALSRLLRDPRSWRVLWYGAGWLMFVIGGCMLGARALWPSLVPGFDVRDFVALTIAGFAMLSLPLALQELTRRHHASAPGR